MFDLALARGTDVTKATSQGGYFDICVRLYHRGIYFAEELLKRGAPIDGGGGDTEMTPFRRAVKLGCFELATYSCATALTRMLPMGRA